MAKRIVIIGASGQLGWDLLKSLQEQNPKALSHQDIEIRNFPQTREILEELKPDLVINLAAYHRVDECEENIEKSFAVNAYGVRHLAELSEDIGFTLIHISTDYVFDGKKTSPYTEDDPPSPLNVYGVSKLAGEYFIKAIANRYYIIRSCGLYGIRGASGKGGNFVETMIRLAREGKAIRVVSDQVLTPTSTKDLAGKIRELIEKEAPFGLYHMTSLGEVSWFGFAERIFKLTGIKPKEFSAVTSKEFGARAKRPSYSVLDNQNLRRVALKEMRPWEDALKEYLLEKGYI
jgi:dTDP-4-dehydrorhamnose reductase